MFFRRPSSTLILVLPRWFGTVVVVVVAADMAATVAAAVAASVAVSVSLSFPQALEDAC
jgi:hypothetical protein